MKRRYLLLGVLAAAAGCSGAPDKKSAAGDVDVDADVSVIAPAPAELDAAFTSSTLALAARMAIIDRYRRSIEQRLPGTDHALAGTTLTEKSVTLAPRAFADITDEPWATMETFSDGKELKRLRLVPPAGVKTETEEFYFNDGDLFFVYKEPDGAIKTDRTAEFGGDAFYFGREGLIAWVRGDGTQVDPNSAAFKTWSTKLHNEAARFARGP